MISTMIPIVLTATMTHWITCYRRDILSTLTLSTLNPVPVSCLPRKLTHPPKNSCFAHFCCLMHLILWQQFTYTLTFKPLARFIALSGRNTLRTRRILTTEMAPWLKLQNQMSYFYASFISTCLKISTVECNNY